MQIANAADVQANIGYSGQHVALHVVVNAHHKAVALAQIGLGDGVTVLIIANAARKSRAISLAERAVDGVGKLLVSWHNALLNDERGSRKRVCAVDAHIQLLGENAALMKPRNIKLQGVVLLPAAHRGVVVAVVDGIHRACAENGGSDGRQCAFH